MEKFLQGFSAERWLRMCDTDGAGATNTVNQDGQKTPTTDENKQIEQDKLKTFLQEKCNSLAARDINSFVALFKKVPKTSCRPMATYSVDERRHQCMDSFGGW
ncbi:MAG: hypothetical protein RR459_07670 [Christensenellaceae bacterium]